jgi:DNA modification methylase
MTVPMSYFRPNTIYCGDCKDVLSQFPNQSVDLIYADPPFFSNFQTALRRANGKEGVIVAFSFGRGAFEEIFIT